MEQTEYFEKNIKVLKKQNKELYEAIKKYVTTESVYYPEQVTAKDGTEVTKISLNGREWFLNSQYRPLQEAVTFVKQYDKVIDYSFMIFLGFGNGILPRQLRKDMGEHTILFFYEPSVEIFLHTLQYYDVSDIFLADNIYVAVEDLNSFITQDVLDEYIQIDNYKLAIYDALPKYRQLFSEQYEWLEDKYRSTVYFVVGNVNTKRQLGKSMTINSILNMKYLKNCNYRDEFKGVFPTDMPAVVVAAGPSLEKNIQVLKKMKGKALIMAVDSVLPYLAEEGLRPDLVVTVDALKPVSLFEDEDSKTLTLVMDVAANNQIAELLSKQKIIFSGGNYIYYQKLFDIAGQDFRYLPNGGSVAHFAFSLLRIWGFQRIVLVGQDLAMAPDKVHAGKVKLATYEGMDKFTIEGYYGDKVYAPWDYNQYRRWYETVLEEEDCPEVINATEGGAKIKGTIQMPLQEVLDNYCMKIYDFEKAIQEVPALFKAQDIVAVEKIWKESIKNLNTLKRKFKEGIRLAEEEIRLISRMNYTKSDMKNIQKRLNKIFEECDSYAEIQFLDYTSSSEEDILDDLYEVEKSNDEEQCRLLEKLKQYLLSMLEALDDVKNLFEGLLSQ